MNVTLEKLEHQRQNPHLYTTLSQSVSADGTIITLEQVTSKITEALNKCKVYHLKKFGTEECGVMCYYQNDDLCKMIEIYYGDIKKASMSFIENYNNMRRRMGAR